MTWAPRALRREGPRYLALADRIADDISAGRLRSGAQLPPQRELAATLGVDLTTVTRAYAEAKRRGLLAGHVGRGTFVRAATRAATQPGGLTEAARIVDLGMNLPPRLDPDLAADALADTLARAAKRTDIAPLLGYQHNAGYESHRAAGAMWIAARGLEAPAERVVVTSGAQHALSVLLSTLVGAGDLVLTEEVTYTGFRAIADQLRLRVAGLPLDDEGIRVDAFRKACKAGAKVLYCTPTLQNPTALVSSTARRRELAQIAAKHGVKIIEDDTYGALVADAPKPLTSHAPDDVYFVASLSKAVAPGLRIGYVLAPTAREADRVAAGVRATTWMAAPLMADIASEWVRDGTAHRILAAHRAAASERQEVAARLFNGWRWRANATGYHGWLELPEPWSSAEFVMQARRSGVALMPGDAFAVDTNNAPAACRLSVSAAPDVASLDDALTRVVRLLELGPGASAPVV